MYKVIPANYYSGGSDISQRQLNETYGRWIPIHSSKLKNAGLNIYDDITMMLVSLRPKRKRDDGIWEVDLENKIAPQGSTCEDVFENWRHDLKDY